ncbi:MAG: hypothetical protein QM796_07020 [Chthoniobacteraceae bacterium]
MKMFIKALLCLVFFYAAASGCASTMGISLYRVTFKVRDPAFAKTVENELNGKLFRKKLSERVDRSEDAVRSLQIKISYDPDIEINWGGVVGATIIDPGEKNTTEQMTKIWQVIEVYIVHRFEGENIKTAELDAFGKGGKR